MMGYGYGGWGMGGGVGFWMVTVWLVVLVDLILAGVWLWKSISKK